MRNHVTKHDNISWHIFICPLWFLLLYTCPGCSATTNLNLKTVRAFLKDLLPSEGTTQRASNHNDQNAAHPNNQSKGKVALDFSGKYEFQITGSSKTIHNLPWIVVTKPPFLQLGFTYNLLSQQPLQQEQQQTPNMPLGNSIFAKLQWNHVHWKIALERIFQVPIVSSCIRLLDQQPSQEQQQEESKGGAFMELRANSFGQAHLVARTPIWLGGTQQHPQLLPPRIHVEYNARWDTRYPTPSLATTAASSKPHYRMVDHPDWWIPDFQISTAGRVESRTTKCWGRNHGGGRATLRWSRSMGWFGDSDTTTRVQLELTQHLSADHSTTVSVLGDLEHWMDTISLCVTHRQILHSVIRE